MLRMRCFAVATVLSLGLLCNGATAESILQLYIEGATYNTETESWELAPEGSSGGAPFRLWAIGNVNGPGGKGDIQNVRLAVVYDADSPEFTIEFTPTTTGGFGGFTDPSVPDAPVLLQTVTDGSTPVLGNGKPLPPHGEYGPGRVWQEYLLGDFTEPGDSPSGDFINSFPTPSATLGAQINAYEIRVLGPNPSGVRLHFDLYDSIEATNHAKFAPFSHDADADAFIVPEPASAWLLASGALLLGGLVLRRRRRHAV